MNDLDVTLRSLRPTESDVDAEFPAERRQQLLAELLATANRPDEHRGPHRASQRPVRRALTVAAGVLVLAGAGVTLQLAPFGEQTPGRVSTMLAPPAAAATLAELAVHAENPAPMPVGGYRHVTRVAGDGHIIDSYVAADGWIWRHDTMPDGTHFYAILSPRAEDLPSDPAALRAALSERASGTESAEQALFKEIGEVVTDATTTPGVRAAAIRVLDAMANEPATARPRPKDAGDTTPTVAVGQQVDAGRTVIMARFVDQSRPGIESSLTFDASTADVVSVQVGDRKEEFRRGMAEELPADLVDAVGTERVEKMTSGS